MFNLLYKLHFAVTGTKKHHITTLKIIKRLSNYILPFYFYLTGSLNSNRLKTNKKKVGLIVSVTTFPARINKVWLTIETILRQQEKPDKILLWLYKGEFNGKDSLPKSLLRLEKRGLEIRFCDENLMPHKKYFYSMKEFPYASVITIDDDMFYPLNLIEKLLKYNKIFPKSIICPITRKISIDGNTIKPYRDWAKMYDNEDASFQIHTMGGGGTFFPPGSLHPNVFDLNKLKELALKADDLWLKVMSLKQGTRVVSIAGEYPGYFLTVKIKNNVRLMDANIHEGQNDFIFQNLLNHYDVKHLLIGEQKQVVNEE